METLECTRCSGVKPISEFVMAGAKDTTKPSNTCSDCHNQEAKYYQKTKKRQLETLTLLEEQKAAENVQWARNIKRNFDPINKIIEE
ncbi:20311_t:CDS:2, partial [Racocetra persica]